MTRVQPIRAHMVYSIPFLPWSAATLPRAASQHNPGWYGLRTGKTSSPQSITELHLALCASVYDSQDGPIYFLAEAGLSELTGGRESPGSGKPIFTTGGAETRIKIGRKTLPRM